MLSDTINAISVAVKESPLNKVSLPAGHHQCTGSKLQHRSAHARAPATPPPASPQGKVALARMQAGEYDRAAARAKLEGLLTSSPVSRGVHHSMTETGADRTALPVATHS